MTATTSDSPTQAPSAPTALEILLCLVVDQVCGYLEADTRDLSAFSLPSTRCAAATRRTQLKSKHLRLCGKSKLHGDLHYLEKVAESGGRSSRSTRPLNFSGSTLETKDMDEDEPQQDDEGRKRRI